MKIKSIDGVKVGCSVMPCFTDLTREIVVGQRYDVIIVCKKSRRYGISADGKNLTAWLSASNVDLDDVHLVVPSQMFAVGDAVYSKGATNQCFTVYEPDSPFTPNPATIPVALIRSDIKFPDTYHRDWLIRSDATIEVDMEVVVIKPIDKKQHRRYYVKAIWAGFAILHGVHVHIPIELLRPAGRIELGDVLDDGSVVTEFDNCGYVIRTVAGGPWRNVETIVISSTVPNVVKAELPDWVRIGELAVLKNNAYEILSITVSGGLVLKGLAGIYDPFDCSEAIGTSELLAEIAALKEAIKTLQAANITNQISAGNQFQNCTNGTRYLVARVGSHLELISMSNFTSICSGQESIARFVKDSNLTRI